MKVEIEKNKRKHIIEITEDRLKELFEDGIDALAERRYLDFFEYSAIQKIYNKIKIKIVE